MVNLHCKPEGVGEKFSMKKGHKGETINQLQPSMRSCFLQDDAKVFAQQWHPPHLQDNRHIQDQDQKKQRYISQPTSYPCS